VARGNPRARGQLHKPVMPTTPDLDDERVTLIAVLPEVVERNRHFMSPRVKRLRADCGGAMVSIGDRVGRC
jgi:hypothetical protein